jgi:hypothetical protein
MGTTRVISRRDRLRRVLILCRNFAVNLAYYRAGRTPEHVVLQDFNLNRHANFWRAVSGNCIDICVLEWCKLLAEPRGKHYWSNIVSDPADFKARLLEYLGIDEAAFQMEIRVMREYRDKFLAHLDSDEVMNIPGLENAKKAVWFYYSQVVRYEATATDLIGVPSDLDSGYAEWECEAREVYGCNAD